MNSATAKPGACASTTRGTDTAINRSLTKADAASRADAIRRVPGRLVVCCLMISVRSARLDYCWPTPGRPPSSTDEDVDAGRDGDDTEVRGAAPALGSRRGNDANDAVAERAHHLVHLAAADATPLTVVADVPPGIVRLPAEPGTEESPFLNDAPWRLPEERRLDPKRPPSGNYRRTTDFRVSPTDPDAAPMQTRNGTALTVAVVQLRSLLVPRAYPSRGRTDCGPRNSTRGSAWRRTTFHSPPSRRKTWVTR